MNLQIQCPKCSKRFTVHEDLTGKIVECGACDHRFPVKPGSLISERSKFYPGEHEKDDFLNRLGREASIGTPDANVAVATPSDVPKVDAIMPASAGQSLAIFSGMGLIILYALIFFLGSGEEGMFQDLLMQKRLLLGGFVSLVGAALIILAANNWRAKAILVTLVMVAGLFALILMRPVHYTPYVEEEIALHRAPKSVDKSLDKEAIKTRVGFLGIQRQIDAMIQKNGVAGPDYVVGIFIENLTGRHFNEIEKYLLKSLSIPPSEGISRYPRNNEKDSLLVISGLALDFDTVVSKCDPRLGHATAYPELRLIDLKLSASLFSNPSDDLLKKLTNPEHPAFFLNNLNELKALDPTRVKAAVTRLAHVRQGIPLQHEEKIVPEFMRILSNENDPNLLSDLGKALRIWAGNQSACVEIAVRNVSKWIKNDVVVPKSFVDYLTDHEAPETPALVDLLWGKEPELWRNQYIALGSAGESRLLFHLEESPLRLKKAAVLILEKIGTSHSLPALAKVKASGDSEMKILAEQAMNSIQSR